MNPMERIKSKKLVIKTILGFTLLEYFFYSITLSNLISNLYEYSNKLNKRVLKDIIAMDVSELIANTGIFKLFWIVIILLTILPAISFYQYYIGEKSIYTMLRLPKKGARLRLYVNQIAPSVKGLLFIWIWQLILLLTFYILYVIYVPSKNQPSTLWITMWSNQDIIQIYPFIKPWFLLPTLSMIIFLPGITMLMVLAERSKKQCILAILGLMISFYGIYSMTFETVSCVVIVPFTTIITLGMGLYYIYKKQIV
jgi:hypothetical protein